MAGYSEIDALREIEEALSKIDDPAAQQRVLTWIWDKFSKLPAPSAEPAPRQQAQAKKKQRRQKKSSTAKRRKTTTGGRPSLDKALNLRPKGKKSFKDFVAEKQPKNNYDRCVVAVYYLRRTLEVTATIDAVFTCFKEVSWRVPADLRNALQSTASRKGWLETKDTDDMKMTTQGENHVEHDLPPKGK